MVFWRFQHFILSFTSVQERLALPMSFSSHNRCLERLFHNLHSRRLAYFPSMYSKALRYADFGPKAISVAQKTVYLEVIWKNSKTVYLWGLVPKIDNQCNFWQNSKLCIFEISASWGRVAQGLALQFFLIPMSAKEKDLL